MASTGYVPDAWSESITGYTKDSAGRALGIAELKFQNTRVQTAYASPSSYFAERGNALDALERDADTLYKAKLAYFTKVGMSEVEAKAQAQKLTTAMMAPAMALFAQQYPGDITSISAAQTFRGANSLAVRTNAGAPKKRSSKRK